jgi:hypothetical protein
VIYLTDGTIPTTNGLPSSGTIQIGFEQMTYDQQNSDESQHHSARSQRHQKQPCTKPATRSLSYVDGQATNAFQAITQYQAICQRQFAARATAPKTCKSSAPPTASSCHGCPATTTKIQAAHGGWTITINSAAT